MAIQFFCGRPGSGKSYGVIENVLLPALKLNRPIYTNIPLNLDAIEADFPDSFAEISGFANEEVTGEFLMSIPGGAVVILDECWRWFPAGQRVNDVDKDFKEFFAEHRHKVGLSGLTQEIVLVSQSPSQIAKFLRDLIDKTVLTIKNNAAGSSKTFTVKIYSACINSIDKPGEAQTSGIGKYKPEVFKYYKSHTKSETSDNLPGVEISADTRGSIWSHWYIRYVAPLILLAAVWAFWFFYDLYTNKYAPAPVSAPVVVPDPVAVASFAAVPVLAPVVVPVPVMVQSKRYRVAGSASFDGRFVVYIHDSTTPHLLVYDATVCRSSVDRFITCHIDNEIVSINTGVRDAQKTTNEFNSIIPAAPAVLASVQ